MSTLTKPAVLSDWLKWEQDNDFSREQAVLVSGQNLLNGAVVGKITASGKLKFYDNGAVDGSEVAYGVLAADCNATSADKACAVIVRDAICAKTKLVFDAGQNQAGKDAAYVDLAAKNILTDRAQA